MLSCISWARTSVSTRSRMTTPELISPESAIFFFHQNNAVRIDWPVGSSDMSTIEHVKDIFGQNTGTQKHTCSLSGVTGGIEADP